MNIEQTLRSSLQTVAREVTVTPEEQVHAEHRFVHRREQGAVRRRWGAGLVAAAAVGSLVLAGAVGWRELQQTATPQPAAPFPEPVAELPLTVDGLAGVWLTSDFSGGLWNFHRNGTVSLLDPTHRGMDVEGPVAYTLTPTGIELPEEMCDWALRLTDDGRMGGRVVRAPASDSPCAGVDQMSWIRLSPRSEVGAGLVWTGTTPEGNAESARVHHSPTEVLGLPHVSRAWLQQGTGRLLVVTTPEDGDTARYVLDDDGELLTTPDDVGEVSIDASGNLVLTSSEESLGCPAGSTAVLAEPLLRGTGGTVPPAPAPALMVSSGAAGCAEHAELGGVWIRVS
ncbi:hypothetical protein ACQE98_11385 [Ornithinimicrobium sp. W1679]|uniref:hypothetical protein n=1 Tax=Ornithinimicrobium sp. W1679 TaxID=3418770 RepID=UPI003CEAA206